ncbi:alpha/beta fold hydrolase [Geodermatophilus marinus]|uniref:alpha/beta fold hydrolase n=1 Tax=Geodermatophilus sp. LHW52908 TaxID=2303986 RepID=UPI0011C14A40|nr:alpha/beta fold hydrolase [Geodermatophilus sp. LHW52908]
MDRRRAALLLSPLLVLAACGGSGGEGAGQDVAAAASATPAGPPPEVEWGACGFQVPAGVQIDCGTLPVPADRADPGAGTVDLAFGVVRTPDPDPAATPVVYLSGGPGQSTLELVPQAYGQLYEPLARGRDLVLLDQRGTGLSQPSLACEEYGSWVRESLGAGLSPEELRTQALDSLEQCRARLVEEEGVDLDDYDSVASAADLDDLRRALGHEQWDLYGISYGTRLAQTVLREHPEGVRSAVLDAAYPVDADLYEETPSNAVRAMEALFDACAADPACAEAHPDLGRTVRDLVAELDAEPAPLTVVDPATGQRVQDELSGAALAGFLFQSLYSTELVDHLPEIIAAADEGRYDTIGLLLGALSQQLDLVAVGQQLAVQCEEEVAFSSREAVAEAAAEHPLVEGFLDGAVTLGPGVFEVCDAWAAGRPDPAADEAVSSDVPVLVFAGELDPITPPRWGEDVVAGLSDARLVLFPHTGHGSLPSHDCAVRIATEFLDDPGTEPGTGCVDEVPPPTFTAAGVDVAMTPFESEELGLAGMRPEGWTEVLPGAHQESALVSLVQRVVPGATAEQLLQQLAAQLGTGQPPQPVEQLQTGALSWDLYRLDDLGQRVELALADSPQGLVLVQLTTTPERADVHREQVFLPAVEALTPAP